ncbi:hypothetical protein T440DRAFT_484367 [Plenodomus tracheiphilus IPT5]|uniref:Cytochrome P450 n=1 Tax=Plenodomus tracheiphilus IPT5 TaxID=1408161 RepID=A0A6A7AME6_9PLEO|nr:hypothetical protein T440DRAFT_484367 [Plenodomus tracheiphilus IPT5]
MDCNEASVAAEGLSYVSTESPANQAIWNLQPGGKKALAETPTFVSLHTQIKGKMAVMIKEIFTREITTAMRSEIQQIVDDVLDVIVERDCAQGPVDLVEDFATPVPTRIIHGILGVPEEDIPELSKASAR